MDSIKATLTGLSTMLMHNSRLANPLDPKVKEMKLLTSKKKKTDEDMWEIARKEFELGLYFDEKLGPFIPTENIRKSIIEGGRLSKLGTAIDRCVQILEDRAPLRYKGPRTVEDLWKEKFYDLSSVGVQNARTMRCRPAFSKWSAEVELFFDSSMVNRDQLLAAMQAAGKFIGIGDYRPRYGRYDVEVAK